MVWYEISAYETLFEMLINIKKKKTTSTCRLSSTLFFIYSRNLFSNLEQIYFKYIYSFFFLFLMENLNYYLRLLNM